MPQKMDGDASMSKNNYLGVIQAANAGICPGTNLYTYLYSHKQVVAIVEQYKKVIQARIEQVE